MKKYIRPELEITEVSILQVIAASVPIDSGNYADGDYEGGGDAKVINFADDASADF